MQIRVHVVETISYCEFARAEPQSPRHTPDLNDQRDFPLFNLLLFKAHFQKLPTLCNFYWLTDQVESNMQPLVIFSVK